MKRCQARGPLHTNDGNFLVPQNEQKLRMLGEKSELLAQIDDKIFES
jgi:hypothetical protein